MKPVTLAMVAAALLALSIGGCRRGMCMGQTKPADGAALVWTTVPADQVELMWSQRGHASGFGVPLPAPAPGEGPVRRVAVRFPSPLDSAKVEVIGIGPRHRVALDDRRVRGRELAVALPALTLERIELVVHHHLRTPPLPPEVRVGREVRR